MAYKSIRSLILYPLATFATTALLAYEAAAGRFDQERSMKLTVPPQVKVDVKNVIDKEFSELERMINEQINERFNSIERLIKQTGAKQPEPRRCSDEPLLKNIEELRKELTKLQPNKRDRSKNNSARQGCGYGGAALALVTGLGLGYGLGRRTMRYNKARERRYAPKRQSRKSQLDGGESDGFEF